MKTIVAIKELKVGDAFLTYNEYYCDFYLKIVHRLIIEDSENIRVLFEYVDINGNVHYDHYTLSMEYRVTKLSI